MMQCVYVQFFQTYTHDEKFTDDDDDGCEAINFVPFASW